MVSFYRVSHLLVDLGWVGIDFSCANICPVLLGLLGIWQKRLCSRVRWRNTELKVNPTYPTQVSEQMNSPVL